MSDHNGFPRRITLPSGRKMTEQFVACECGDDRCSGRMLLTEMDYGPAYMCQRFPWNDLLVYAHADGRPLGTATNSLVRYLRYRTHELFDPVWRDCDKRHRGYARKAAYEWLRMKLGLRRADCHIGKFDKRLCLLAIKLLESGERPDLAHMDKKIRKRERRSTRQARLREASLDGKTKKYDSRRGRSEDLSRLLDPQDEADGERLED